MPRLLEDVAKIFGTLMPHDISNYDSVGIARADLLEGGEVPAKWLKSFKDNKTWKDLSFTTNCSCGEDAPTFYDMLSHECQL